MSGGERCAGCLAPVPESTREHELITSKLGWRLSRRAVTNGEVVHEWRCPACAERSRRLRALTGSSSGSYPAVSSSRPPPKKPEK